MPGTMERSAGSSAGASARSSAGPSGGASADASAGASAAGSAGAPTAGSVVAAAEARCVGVVLKPAVQPVRPRHAHRGWAPEQQRCRRAQGRGGEDHRDQPPCPHADARAGRPSPPGGRSAAASSETALAAGWNAATEMNGRARRRPARGRPPAGFQALSSGSGIVSRDAASRASWAPTVGTTVQVRRSSSGSPGKRAAVGG